MPQFRRWMKMKDPGMKNLLLLLLFLWVFESMTCAQKNSTPVTSVTYSSFIDYQKSLQRPAEAITRKEDTLRKQFETKKLVWPAKYIYIRSFKYDSQLEVWVKNDLKEPFRLFKTYKVCAFAGTLGPKRMEGDFQVPEGFYYINQFNPKSTYYLSLGLNYPNASDKILSDSLLPGGDIYIHGSCVTIGCIPLTDNQIDELYILAAYAKNAGQDFIPVHIFPIRYNVQRSFEYLTTLAKDDPQLKQFAMKLEDAFDYFEKYRQLPVIMTDEKGNYIVDGVMRRSGLGNAKEKQIKKRMIHRTRIINDLADAVHQSPMFPGGVQSFLDYLSQLGNEMVAYLPAGVKKSHILVEFIIDKDGTPVNFKVIKGVDEDFDDELISHLEKMPIWQPALLNDKPVAKKIKQSIEISAE
jgi:murein L,D-transpeptidase YafK